MSLFQVAAIMCGFALYVLLLGTSLWLAIFATQDPECRFGGIFLSLLIIGVTCLALGC